MKITLKWLEDHRACRNGKIWFSTQNEIDMRKLAKLAIECERFNDVNWVLTRLMSHKQNVQYACYSAKQSLHIFERTYPKDKRPRLAIKAALEWVKNPTDANQPAASAAMSAESAAGSAVWSAESAAASAAWKRVLKYGLRLVKDI
jgi:hypothetical protein